MTITAKATPIVNPNMTRKPVEMLLGLINIANNLGLKEADVQIRPPVVIASPVAEQVEINGVTRTITRNTRIEIDVLTDDVQDDFVTFTYERIDLDHLFSVCNPELKEVDIKDGENITPATVAAEILRKYKILAGVEDFDFTITPTTVVMASKAVNLAYIGSATILVEPSLMRRLQVILLDGFELPTPAVA